MTAKPNWTDEEVATLARMWAEGSSAREIAKALGNDRTRNSVMGRLNRMGLSRNPTGVHGGTITRGHKPERAPRPSRAKDITIKQVTGLKRQQKEARVSAIVCQPVEGGVELLDLQASHCRYPLGEVRARPPYKYCGDTVVAGKSYCPGHHAVVWQAGTAFAGHRVYRRAA